MITAASDSSLSLPVESKGVKVIHATIGGREVSQRVFDDWIKAMHEEPETKRSRLRDSDDIVEDPADLSMLSGQCASLEIDVPCYDECWPRAAPPVDDPKSVESTVMVAETAGADTIYGMLDELDDI
ncbi:hypothetical protein Pmar_PMAR002163 [Perkinsus marinus ATCC 50983]|uniref:Uncharacterized protein n=1 Tax=Perkinsus marinus (strain ATCC 50983 / TXsc) TaxID=423536 RepID=C5L8T6_PERM5|nr:hypothetical protein Pmar_PMAR002163 [Perkinsus marinus ATCC 50983]EER06794.1 hypothetical protein Pmar_PMAR002163 [Perkinsus marinus ATCC 50983]|eukprot:XP_002774978.1 hypothetical protein Pmar_PMAR002163 [Perkinsus marinus ATCC 50983]